MNVTLTSVCHRLHEELFCPFLFDRSVVFYLWDNCRRLSALSHSAFWDLDFWGIPLPGHSSLPSSVGSFFARFVLKQREEGVSHLLGHRYWRA